MLSSPHSGIWSGLGMHRLYAWACMGSMHGHAQVIGMGMHGFYAWACMGSMHAVTTADTQWISLQFAAINKRNEYITTFPKCVKKNLTFSNSVPKENSFPSAYQKHCLLLKLVSEITQ